MCRCGRKSWFCSQDNATPFYPPRRIVQLTTWIQSTLPAMQYVGQTRADIFSIQPVNKQHRLLDILLQIFETRYALLMTIAGTRLMRMRSVELPRV